MNTCVLALVAAAGCHINVDSISVERIERDIATLASFGTRHTLSSTDDPARGIGAAREWILAEFKAAGGGLVCELEHCEVPPSIRVPHGAKIANVVARLEGTMPEARDRVYYVVGHYDSRNGDAMDAVGDAPGANDDASGTSVVMELARVLAKSPPESSVVFLCTAGEEQGLLGAKCHVDNAIGRGDRKIMGVLNNDIVGDPWGPRERSREAPERWQVRVFSHGLPRNPDAMEYANIKAWGSSNDSVGRQLARHIFEVANERDCAVKPVVVFRDDRFLRGGDHTPFAERGIPAVRFTAMHEDYSRQHANIVMRENLPYGDTADHVEAPYVADVARLNLAALIAMANAPRPPANVRMMTSELMNDTELKWEGSPEPDVAGYEVVWRETTDWNWSHAFDAGKALSARVPVSKDNCFFGVRAYDKDGNRSPVTFAGAGKE